MIPKDLLYTKEHEWVLIEDEIATVGITDHAQSELGDIVFIELPGIGDTFEQDSVFGTIEAVKTVADMFCPVSGEIIEVNDALTDAPEKINGDCYGEGWIIKVKMSDPDEANSLLSPEEYADLIDSDD